MKKIIFLLILLFCFVSPQNIFAKDSNNNLPSITVINLLRGKDLGHEKDNLYQSLKDQWAVTSNLNVKATWLWQYTALEDKAMTDFAKKSMKNQEFGLLFEIDRNSAQKSGVSYRGQGPSYFSDGLLLVSYDRAERKKLIDASFDKFKSVFGYYPKTVGAWWIGADSISYMQEKYGITAALRASDQFALDVYTIWGSPFSVPYVSSKENEGLPARTWDDSSKVVILQWAARDPVKGYNDSTYSLQDYTLKGYGQDYVNYLLNTYLKGPLDDIVLGLENGGDINVFNGFYKTALLNAKNLENNGKVKIQLAKDYADKFLKSKEIFSKRYILANSFDSKDQAFWYFSQNYRALIGKTGNNLYLLDLRNYTRMAEEDFSLLPNSQGNLWVGEKYIIDSKLFSNTKEFIGTVSGEIKINNDNNITSLYDGNNKLIELSPESLNILNRKVYNFPENIININVFSVLVLFYVFYFFLFYFLIRNKKRFAVDVTVFLVILFLAYPYLVKLGSNNFNFFLDKKEELLFYFLPLNIFNNIKINLTIIQLIPLLGLTIFHFIYITKNNSGICKKIYYFFIVFCLFVYFHLFYFPLNLFNITIISVIILIFLLTASLFLYKYYIKNKSRNLKQISLAIFLVVVIFATSCVTSRAKQVITPFEIDALQVVRNQKEDVIYVSQIDYFVKPIYKAVRPLIYENVNLASRITNVNWDTVLRPENHILRLQNYKNKLIFIPRYLGSDISEHETNNLGLIKIFDNLQIAIYKSK